MASAKQKAAARRNIKKAQIVSARKRRLAPNKRPPAKSGGRRLSRKKIILGTGVAVGLVVAGGAVRTHVRENALQRKHGDNYIPRKVTGYHHTYRQHHRNILKNQKFKTKSRFHDKQKSNEVWFTTGSKEGSNMALYGDYVVKVKFKRSDIAQHHKGWAKTGPTRRGQQHNAWFSVSQSKMKGKKIKNHYVPKANPIHGTRQQQQRAANVRAARLRLSRPRFSVSRSGVAMELRPV